MRACGRTRARACHGTHVRSAFPCRDLHMASGRFSSAVWNGLRGSVVPTVLLPCPVPPGTGELRPGPGSPRGQRSGELPRPHCRARAPRGLDFLDQGLPHTPVPLRPSLWTGWQGWPRHGARQASVEVKAFNAPKGTGFSQRASPAGPPGAARSMFKEDAVVSSRGTAVRTRALLRPGLEEFTSRKPLPPQGRLGLPRPCAKH